MSNETKNRFTILYEKDLIEKRVKGTKILKHIILTSHVINKF